MIALRCYDPSDDQEGGIHGWYFKKPPAIRAAIDAVLRTVAEERGVDTAPQLKALRGSCRGLTEVLVDFELRGEVIHIRILGFEVSRHEFILLIGFRKRGNAGYGAACRSAHQRRLGVLRDGQRAGLCRFPPDRRTRQ